MASNPFVLIFWLVCVAVGCLGTPYWTAKGKWYGPGGGVALLIAILMIKFVFLSGGR